MMKFSEARAGLNICMLTTRLPCSVVGEQCGWRSLTLVDCRYGMVLAKEKNDEKALEFLIRSVHKYPMNWGCWLEMTSLISRVEDVS